MDYAEKPKAVSYAEIAIWTCMGIRAVAALIDRRIHGLDAGAFVIAILFYALLCFLPFFIGRRSNVARIAFAIVTAAAIFLWLGGLGSAMTLTSKLSGYITIPVSMLALYWLFTPEANRWFRVRWFRVDRRAGGRPRGEEKLAVPESSGAIAAGAERA